MSTKYTVIGLLLFLMAGCGSDDTDKVPRNIKGVDVFVINKSSGREHKAGRIGASYYTKGRILGDCKMLAGQFATERHIANWDYSCCTVTPKSSCASRIK